MAHLAKEIFPVNIEDELKQSYLDYAMSVIVGRALPDVRDGLKPVHRRSLFAMSQLDNSFNKPYKKSARIVGDVIGKYHPHGESAVYDTIVRMAQPFSMRYMLVDGQGNFGSVDGDPPAAMRYTEVRMAKITHALLADLDKNTVDFIPNYDESEIQPVVLPTRVPNLLINGSSGIAVGMATNIPPHNLSEVINACLAMIEDPNISVDKLIEHLPGPDFPTAGIINGHAGIIEAYKTGRGKIYIRARTEIESDEASNKQAIIINELPYQVNKARLLEKIAELVKDKKIEGITALRDESDKDGMRVVIELRKGTSPDVMLNNLYSQTQLQSVFGINMVALVDNQPKLLNLRQIIACFIDHRKQVVSRRTEYELNKDRERAHILEGLAIALANIDTVIAIVKAATSPQQAKESLINAAWQLSAIQAQAILDLKLHRLTGLEQEKIIEELKEIKIRIQKYLEILSDINQLMQVIKQELIELKKEFGDARRTEIITSQQDLSIENLITEENMVVTLSQDGYVKAQQLNLYQAQKRGGRGKIATLVKDEDYVTQLLIANTHDTLLCFSSIGKVYWLKVYQLPIASRTSKGRPIVNLLSLQADEHISAILAVRDYQEDKAIFMATANGTVKKVALTEFNRPRANGIIAIDLTENDSLVGAELTSGTEDILLTSNSGKAIRFSCQDVRCIGRSAKGVRGIKLQPGQKVISLIVLKNNGTILTATRNGYGKRTKQSEFSKIGRGGQGVIAIQTTERNGDVVGALEVNDNDDVMLISDKGTLVRIKVNEISTVGRNTQGVILINLAAGEHLVGIQRIDELSE